MSKRTLPWAFVALSLAACVSTPAAQQPQAPQQPMPMPAPDAAAQPRSATRAAPAAAAAEPPPASGERPPALSAEARQVRAVAYSADAVVAWPRDARRRQLIISNGSRRGEHFAWLVADGTRVVSLYALRDQADLDSMIVRVGRNLVGTAPSSPFDSASWGIAGTIVIPDPPDPPGPGGYP